MQKRVLVADDASFMRELIKDILVKQGYQIVAEAVSGDDAVKKYREHRPDIITMDIVMNDKNGIEATREIMSFDPNARILVVSALGNQGMVVEAIQAGAKGFIIKPFRAEVLIEEVIRVVGD